MKVGKVGKKEEIECGKPCPPDEPCEECVGPVKERCEPPEDLEEPPDPAFQDLGWANGWKETPQIVKKCREEKHKVVNLDRSGNRGLHHEVKCTICKYIYHYDSS